MTEQQSHKILFLDIDGPLVNHRTSFALEGSGMMRAFDPVAVNLLNRLYKNTGAEIVISSTWRKLIGESMIDILAVAGIRMPVFGTRRDDFMTPVCADGNRGSEIDLWFLNHETLDVSHFAVLDDEISDLEQYQIDRTARTSTMDGMSFENYQTLMSLLEGTEDFNRF